jgi:hypothetical protein
LYSLEENGRSLQKEVAHINAYLVGGNNVIVDKQPKPISQVSEMTFGNTPIDGGHLLFTRDEVQALMLTQQQYSRFVRRIYGSAEFIRGIERHCLWIEDEHLNEALSIPVIHDRINNVRALRLKGGKTANDIATRSHQFQRTNIGKHSTIVVPRVSSESRTYLPAGYLSAGNIVSDSAFAIYDAPLWNLALVASRLHLVWIATVCGKLKTDFRYSNTLGWNTFPLPKLTEKNREDLTHCAEDILLAREMHFPATIAELYDPDNMPENLRRAHDQNDEVLERIYIGRRFKNDTERLEKLFEHYTKMTANKSSKTS